MLSFFFFNIYPTTVFYILSLPDALPILESAPLQFLAPYAGVTMGDTSGTRAVTACASTTICRSRPSLTGRCRCCSGARSEEHTSELQSHVNLVCRLLLEKKKEINSGRLI